MVKTLDLAQIVCKVLEGVRSGVDPEVPKREGMNPQLWKAGGDRDQKGEKYISCK